MCRGRDGPAGRRHPGRCASRDPSVASSSSAPSARPWPAPSSSPVAKVAPATQVGHYPSYYPDEIRIDVIDPAAAAKGLSDETLHAYVGAVPGLRGSGTRAREVGEVARIVSGPVLQSASARFASAEARCAAARGILAALAQEEGGRLRFSSLSGDALSRRLPAPSRTGSRRQGAPSAVAAPAAPVQGRRQGASSPRAVVRGAAGARGQRRGRHAGGGAGRRPARRARAYSSTAGPGRRGCKEGWFHAHRLLAPGLDAGERDGGRRGLRPSGPRRDPQPRGAHGPRAASGGRAHQWLAERMVVGYALKEEFFNEEYPEGVENIAYDCAERPQLRRLHPHREAQGLPLERQAAPGRARPCRGRLESGCRLHRRDGPADLVGHRRSGHDPVSVQRELDAQPRAVGSHQGGRPVRRHKVPADAMRPQAPATVLLQRVGDTGVRLRQGGL